HSSVTVAIGTNAGSGTLSGTATVTAVSGVAVFNTLSINKAGVGYTLAASDTGRTEERRGGNASTAAAATQGGFTVQPSNATAAQTIDGRTGVQVSVEHSFGNVVSTDRTSVTVAIGTNAGSGTLSGTTTVTAVSGVAVFNTLSINKTGVGYTLAASDTG